MKVTIMIGENKVELEGVTDIKIEDEKRDTINVETEDSIYYRVICKSEVFSLNENKSITFDKNTILKIIADGTYEYIMEDSLGNRYLAGVNVINHGLKPVVDDELTRMLFKQSKAKSLVMAEN
ncbi:hypothetical protein P3U41_06035 [Mammaliicoccus sciuri]|uniref:hypothetical protein n=1 Tax=Mammaliicoccus sciuri TaxID=1296 RepID=UPI002B25F52C|nr:hypothetical protein [Mammaliicoccus sciuri]WQL34330.1 hypothetical protein P3U41_06035 [Mammaliicoccus sciuri]WQL61269.1 hypothetical protein P3T96_06035 [Mammaliicoccus sciuri]